MFGKHCAHVTVFRLRLKTQRKGERNEDHFTRILFCAFTGDCGKSCFRCRHRVRRRRRPRSAADGRWSGTRPADDGRRRWAGAATHVDFGRGWTGALSDRRGQTLQLADERASISWAGLAADGRRAGTCSTGGGRRRWADTATRTHFGRGITDSMALPSLTQHRRPTSAPTVVRPGGDKGSNETA